MALTEVYENIVGQCVAKITWIAISTMHLLEAILSWNRRNWLERMHPDTAALIGVSGLMLVEIFVYCFIPLLLEEGKSYP